MRGSAAGGAVGARRCPAAAGVARRRVAAAEHCKKSSTFLVGLVLAVLYFADETYSLPK